MAFLLLADDTLNRSIALGRTGFGARDFRGAPEVFNIKPLENRIWEQISEGNLPNLPNRTLG